MTAFNKTPRPLHSIWGQVDEAKEIMNGMWRVHTPSHGGIILSPERLDHVPLALQYASFNRQGMQGFFEEDCDMAIPLATFFTEYRQYLRAVRCATEERIEEIMKTVNQAVDRIYEKSI